MAAATEVFRADIAATDNASKTIDEIKAHLKSLGQEAEHVGHQEEHIHHPHMWMALGEHIDVTKEHFHGLHASIGEVGQSVTELLPAFAAFGAAASVAALFETTEHVAENYAEMAHSAASLGVQVEQFHQLQMVAKLTDTNVEGMEKSVSRLNRTLGEAAIGKNKDAAALFKQLHLNPRSFKDGADALPALADAFQHTASATMRARMAFTLFGRSGVDMIPMLMQGGDKLREYMEEAGKLGINFKPYAKDLERYNEDQKKLNIAVGGFTDLLGGKLDRVLAPLSEEATDFVAANREWITGEIAGGVQEFATWLQHLPFNEIAADARAVAHETGVFVEDVGGAKVVVEALAAAMALKGVMFLVEPVKEAGELALAVGKLVIKIGTELVGAWTKVGTAAKVAGAEEMAAAEIGAGGGGAGGAARSAEKEARLIRGITRVAGVLPFAGAAIEGLSVVAQTLPVIMGVDVDTQHGSAQTNAMHGGQGGNAGGRHDYGVAEHRDPHDHRRVDDVPKLQADLGQIIDRVTDALPRPLWSQRPGYAPETVTRMLARRDQMLDAAGHGASGALMALAAPDLSPLPPPIGTGRPQKIQDGKVDITIHTPDLPANSRVETDIRGNVGQVRTNLGEAWMGGLG